MFKHLDFDNDNQLSVRELYNLKNNKREMCLSPFIEKCDIDKNKNIGLLEWCMCFGKSERPCAALKHELSLKMQGKLILIMLKNQLL